MANATQKARAQASLAGRDFSTEKSGKGKSGKPENTSPKPMLADDEIEQDDQPEPRTIDEANSQKKAKNKKADKKANAAPKLTPEERRAKREAEDTAVRAGGGVVRTANGRVSARGLPCLCGCGRATVTDEARFVSGHDAQLRQRFIKGEQTLDSPESRWIKPFYEAGETIAGFTIEGGELVNVHASTDA